MNPQDYNAFATALQERGYKKFTGGPCMGHHYWCKPFAFTTTSDGERQPEYQVIFKVFYYYGAAWGMKESDFFGVTHEVLVSRNRCLKLDFTAYEHLSVEEIEQKALSFYEWAKQNLEI